MVAFERYAYRCSYGFKVHACEEMRRLVTRRFEELYSKPNCALTLLLDRYRYA